MPNNKKHHYVPRFYLKRFSPNNKSICLWNIPKCKKVLAANLKNQCYRDYFYGKEQRVENALGDIESQASQLIRIMGEADHPPLPLSNAHYLLLIYIVTQFGRTSYSADMLNEMTDDLMKQMSESRGLDNSAEKFRIRIKNATQFSLSLHIKIYPLLFDLEYKFLTNETNVEFITSDNPIVLYNQLLSFRKNVGNTGFASKGLQIFFPISTKRLLFFYDSSTYSVKDKKQPEIKISLPQDVYQLNTLQFCSAYENVYFKSENFNVEALHRKAKPFRRQNKSNMEVFSGKNINKKSELIAIRVEDINTNLKLSFVSISKSSKKWRLEFRKLKEQPVVVVRNQQLCEDHEDFLEKVESNEYSIGEFRNYLDDKYM